MDAITKLKTEVNLVEHISKRLWQKGINETQWVRFKAHEKDKNPSLLVYKDQNKGYMDYSWVLGWWSIIDFELKFTGKDKKEVIKDLCAMYNIESEKKEFKKSPKRTELVEKFESYKMKKSCPWFERFLQLRWIKYDFITENKDFINKLAQEFWFAENIWIKDKIYKDCIIFPCYKNDEICWAKLRTIDWTPFSFGWKEIKSVSVWKPYWTWLIYEKEEISSKFVLIVEWETDYLILKLLWFKSVIWNLWWVSAHADEIQKLTKNVDKIICLYDNDWPWLNATYSLQDKIWRPIRKVIYPKIDWLDKYDINDLYNQGWRKEDFIELIKNSVLLDEFKKDEIIKQNPLYEDRIFYHNIKMEYFDIKDFSFKSLYSIARHFWQKPKEFDELRLKWEIPTYDWICYFDWWKKWLYNLLDKKDIIKPSNNPTVHEDIQFLIKNICWWNKENMEWLLKAILYKYTHLNDVLIPAVVFHWVGWTWKWLFIKLLSKIFWENNTQIWLTQESIESRFATYTWQKLIVEFKELSVDNTAKWKKNMQKLKTFIMEDKIIIEKKGQDPISTENIAWFIMSSNENKPIQLDSSDSWNRRFSIIKTWTPIWLEKWWKIAEAIKDKKNVENFLAYLFKKYPEIPKAKNILPLDNEDKRELELLSESVWNLFFKWFEEKYPNVKYITNKERNFFLNLYREEIGEDDYINNDRYKINYFNNSLSVRYKVIATTIKWKKFRWYRIEKEVEWDWLLPEWEIKRIIQSKNDLVF